MHHWMYWGEIFIQMFDHLIHYPFFNFLGYHWQDTDQPVIGVSEPDLEVRVIMAIFEANGTIFLSIDKLTK